ncbi:Zinc finger in N-recognin family protein [Brugia malayi]|uniref:E3 ubiquitin-protein ligase n=3 Tax=Brugia malayi TaxID=6279 RepID=A0A0K0J6C1_BRUMA|nr:Zinc finger in N-recognin family protein [Brugia malayi]CRZ21740.1 BMA-UBR-1 [Brugia malayi]VIO97030.1 Zinc finger in N-recognin family protein [Brugia malayi]
MIDKLISLTRASNWDEVEHILVDYWTQQCPLICAPTEDPSFDFKIDDNTFNEKLLHPTACAYCLDKNVGTDLMPLNASYGSKSSANRRSAYCGHVFRGGEATYSCKECACDPTCVICYQCFLNSAHKSHKYRMCASNGNGCCDCGDVEAWKEHPACKLHEVGQNEEQDSEIADVPAEITEQVETRIRSLTRIVLRFSIGIICWLDENTLPTFLKERGIDTTLPLYQTILLNDETHTFDSVIRALNLSIHCNHPQALQLATVIDREGRASVRNGNIDYCIKAKDEIQRRTQRDSNHRTEKSGPLDVRVIDSRFVSLQNFAVRLVGWLTNQARHLPALALMMGEILLNEKVELEVSDSTGEVDQTLMAHILRCDRALWKGARIGFHQMIMATVLMNSEQKKAFSRLYIRLYKKIYDDFIDDDHDQSVSVTVLTVQIFTVPTIARMLIAEESVLQIVLHTLSSHCRKYLKAPNKRKFDFSSRSYPHTLRRALYMLCDLRYLLSVIPSQQDWTPQLRENFLSGCSSLIRFLSFMQGMDEVRRQTAEHQVWEQEWETAFNIQIKLQHVLALVICWCNSDEFVHSRLMSQLIDELEAVASHSPDFANKIVVEVNGMKATSIPFDLSYGSLSVHQPFWRLLAGLFIAEQTLLQKICVRDEAEKVPEGMINLKGKRALLMEMPLRIFVLCSQSQAQMWRRNGFSLVNQIHNYSAPTCRAEMFDRDILMLQVCAALTPPDTFIIRVLHRFGLRVWAETNFEEIRAAFSNVASDDLSKCTVTLAEEMLHLLIIIIGERYLPGVGKSTIKTLLRREVLHVLATKPTPFSKIQRAMPVNLLFADLSVEEAVKSVGDFRKPTKTSPGIFLLKDSARSEYNAFFYHYSKTDVSNAEQYRQKCTNKALKKEAVVAAPPMPPQFESFFAPIINLLRSKMMMQLIRIVLDRTARRSRYSSDGLLHRILFLVGMGLNEQTINSNFDFIGCAEEANIFTLMKNLNGKPESEPHADLLGYLLQRYEKTKSESKEAVIQPGLKAPDASESEIKAKKAAIAAKKRKQAMDQMSRLQKQFVTQNQDLLGKEFLEGKGPQKHDDDEEPLGILPHGSGFPICLGIDRSIAKCDSCRRVTCILCQEDEDITADGQALVCAAFMQKSSLFAKLKQEEEAASELSKVFVSVSLRNGLGSSTCGHVMHFNCYKKFSDLLKDRDRGRNPQLMAFNPRVLDINSGEYLCPLCKRLSNTILPILPPLAQVFDDRIATKEKHIEFEDWINHFVGLFDSSINNDKSFKGHSKKRSHSERSLMELVSREAETGNALSASVPSTSAMSFMMEMNPVVHPKPDEIMEVDDNEERTLKTAVKRQSGPDGRFFSIFTSIPDVMHKIKDMLIQPEKQQSDSARTHFSPVIWDMIHFFLKQTNLHLQNDGTTSYFNEEIMEAIFTFQSAAFSLRSIATVLRRGGKPLFGAWNARQRECIYALSRSCAVATMKCHSSYYYLRFLLLQLLSPLLSHKAITDQNATVNSGTDSSCLTDQSSVKALEAKKKTEIHLPEGVDLNNMSQLEFAVAVLMSEDIKKPINILAIDMLSLAVEMAMCEGWEPMNKNGKAINNKEGFVTFPHGSENEQYAIRLALIGHLYQVIATFDVEILSKQSASPFVVQEDKMLDDLLLRLYAIARPGKQLSSVIALKKTLHTAVLEFLRPLSLLYHALTLVPPPEALKDPSVNEFEPLCRYLGFIPSLGEFLGGLCVEKLFTLWASSQGDKSQQTFVRQPVLENSFVELPEDFSELINYAASFRCPSIPIDDRSSSAPSLCLLCGSLLCSQIYCCQRTVNGVTLGACSYHLKICTGCSGGVFLRIRDCQVVLLTSRDRGCLLPAPYIDDYGEADPGFRRGNPLHLSHELYAKLENLWLNQSIAEEVANQYEIDHRNIGLEWHHF